VVARHYPDHPLSPRRPPIARSHRHIRPALVDKDERGRIEVGRLGPPRGPFLLVPLTSVQNFF
jgi:hypothetical protein